MAKPRAQRASDYHFARLEPRSRRIPEKTIRKKWKQLNNGSQDQIKQLILSLKRQPLVGQKRKANYEGLDPSVDEVAQRLVQRLLPRMQVPPSAEESHFDFEGTLDRVYHLESQLSTNANTVHLLKEEIRREKKALALDNEELQSLEGAFRSNQAIRKEQSRTLHPLARMKDGQDVSNPHEHNALITDVAPSLQGLEDDAEAQSLVQQIRSHMQSMQANTLSMRPVTSALQHAQATLDVLSAHLPDNRIASRS